MKREDLFIAIGSVDSKRLARCEVCLDSSLVTHWEDITVDDNHGTSNNKPHRFKQILLIAAIVTLMLLMMGSAIFAFVRMKTEDVKMYAAPKDTASTSEEMQETIYEGEIVHFEQVNNKYIPLGAYYPQIIPDGYKMTFVSNDAPLQNQVIHYENDDGYMIKYWLYVGSPASNIEIYNIKSKTNVKINQLRGILYEQEGGSHMVVWSDPQQGYGFAIMADEATIDVVAMAESTAEGEPLVSTRNDKTLQALKELGDFEPTYLPEGYQALTVAGSPLDEGGWYSYVRKWYINSKENSNIYFEYETYVIVTDAGYTDDAKTACALFIPGYYILQGKVVGEETEINGMFGIVAEKDIAWADPETHQVYHLHAEDISKEELLKVAQSITQKQ